MKYKLYKGDCLEVMKDIPDKSIDMILCDLPYSTTRNYWDCAIHEALNVWGSHENHDIVITHTSNHDNGQKYIKFFEERMEKGFELLPREKYYYGGECFVFGQYDKCINILESFVKDNYNGVYENKRTRDYLGKCYKIKKNYYKSLENYLQYMRYDKPTHNVIFEIADCCYNLNRTSNCLGFLIFLLRHCNRPCL